MAKRISFATSRGGGGGQRRMEARDQSVQKSLEIRITAIRGALVKIIPTLIAITALPLMALGQAADQQQDAGNRDRRKNPRRKLRRKRKRRTTGKSAAQLEDRREHARRDQSRGSERRARRSPKPGPLSTKTQTKVNVEEFKSQPTAKFYAWAASQRVLRPALRGEPFPVDWEQLLRLCGQLLGRG